MKYLDSSSHFKRQLKKLPPSDREKTSNTLKNFLKLLHEGPVPTGLGFKKIGDKHYEIRVNIRLRILMKAENDTLTCHVIGNHDDIENYLKKC